MNAACPEERIPLRWYVVHTKVRGEATAVLHLERQGYHVYFPRLVRARRLRDGCSDRIEPLFPRYVFVQVDAARQSLAPIRSTIGVSGLVRFGDEYATVPGEVMDELGERSDPETGLFRLNAEVLAAGAAVRVAAGPFEGLEGIFERYEGEERVLILLQLLGRATAIRMPAAQVVPALA